MTTLHKAEIPLTLLLLPFITGLGFAVIFPCTGYLVYLVSGFYVVLSVFVFTNLFYKRLNIYKARWIGGALVHILLLLAGMISVEMHREINSDIHFSKHKADILVVKISSEPKLNEKIARFTAIVEEIKYQNNVRAVTGNLMVSVMVDSATKNRFTYGDELLIPANFTPVEAPLNPAEFNYKAYLAHQNIYQQSFLPQSQVITLRKGQGNPVIANALALRKHLVEKLSRNMHDTNALAVASTIILGYRADLRKEVQEAYSKTGTMHLLSVSGMHVGLVYLLISFLLAFLPPKRYGKVIKAAISITLIWCYAVITGFSPAVCRAAMMLSLFIVGFTFNRHINRLNLLALSAFIFLLYNPFLITDAGFQLSYLAVFGIIILQPIIYKWVNLKSKLGKRLWMVCSVSIAAQVILFPVSAFYFHDLPVYFLVSNVFIIVPSAIIMYGGILYLALPQIPVVSAALGWLLEKTIMIMTGTLTAIEHAPLGSINKIWINTGESVLIFGLISSGFYCIVRRDKKRLKLSIAFLTLIAISMSFKRYNAMNTDTITFFSLRKNSAILFRNGDKAVLLTDLKPTDKTYQYSIQPYLDSCKITDLQNIGLDKNIKTNYVIKQQNLVRFGNIDLLVIDRSSQYKLFAEKLNIDYLYITGSPHADLNYLKRNYNFKTLIVDGHNSSRAIEELEQQAVTAHINFRNLKRNNSLIIVSNN